MAQRFGWQFESGFRLAYFRFMKRVRARILIIYNAFLYRQHIHAIEEVRDKINNFFSYLNPSNIPLRVELKGVSSSYCLILAIDSQ